MVPSIYLISGLPGTGKSTVCSELQLRGYAAIDADRAIAFRSSEGWQWDENKFDIAVANSKSDIVFVCGSASNRGGFLDKFQKIFILHIDDKTLKYRLEHRTNNDFGKDPAVLARQISNNQGIKEYSEKRGRIVIDATQPIDKVVDKILSLTRGPTQQKRTE